MMRCAECGQAECDVHTCPGWQVAGANEAPPTKEVAEAPADAPPE